ncbi:MAG: MMPL family transporter [Planctomycetaceae bacterium]|nr:MMPL family transporter [Planctomycetaceae bacterium]
MLFLKNLWILRQRFLRNFFRHPLQLLLIIAAFAIFPVLIFFASEARKNASNQVIDWLPAGLKETEEFYDYLTHFPEGELLMISWDGATLDDGRFAQIAERLLAPVDAEQNAYFSRVMTSRSVLDLLTGEPLYLSEEDAKSRMRGWMLGKNDQDACLVAIISGYGSLRRPETIGMVYDAVQEITKLPSEQVQIAGPSIDSVAIDSITAASQRQLLPLFLLLCLIMLLFFLRHFIAAFFVFFIASTNSELGPAIIHLTKGHMDSISMLIGSLVYALTISAGIYLTTYYRETLRAHPVQRATRIAIRKALLPCFLSMLTTVLGLVSLCSSKMIPIFNFGMYAAVTLVVGTAWLFVTFVAVTRLFSYRRWRWLELTQPTATFQHRLQGFWLQVAGRVRQSRTFIVVLGLLVAIFFAFQLPQLKTTVTFHGMFPDNAKVIRDYNTLEERVGGLIPIEVVLDIPAQSDGKTAILNELWLLQDVAMALGNEPGIDTVISALNFAPNLPTWESSVIQRVVFERKLSNHAKLFEDIRFLHLIRNEEGSSAGSLWRMSLRIPAYAHLDYEQMLSGLRQRLDILIAGAEQNDLHGVTYLVTGGVPLVHRAQQQLLDDLITSFLYAFATITLTMIILLRGLVQGIVAMIPNVFPCVIVFGMMAWFGKPIDMGAMMTASVAIGIAVDGTLHFMTWFRRGIQNGFLHHQAVTYAYQHCATAMTQTTFICSFGMLVFCMSGFLPIAKFATMLCFLLLTSLIGGLVLLPALLYGPIGKIFERKNNTEMTSWQMAPHKAEANDGHGNRDREPEMQVSCPS